MMCSVDGCTSKQEAGRSFFRCPKEKTRCETWKRALGFVGTHKYADYSPEECNNKVKICDLHFTEGSYVKHQFRALLLHNAVPTLNLCTTNYLGYKDVSLQTDTFTTGVAENQKDASVQTEDGDVPDYKPVWIKTEIDDGDGSYDYQNVSIKTEPLAGDDTCYKDVSLQTDVFAKDYANYKDASEQTYIFARNKSTQTIAALSANTATVQKITERNRSFKRAATPSTSSVKKQKCQTELETGITKEDIHKYLEQNYSEQSYKLLKMQLNLLNKSPKGCRYTDTFKKFALSISFLGPKVYKQFSAFYRLPSKTTLKRFTRNWMINQVLMTLFSVCFNLEQKCSTRKKETALFAWMKLP